MNATILLVEDEPVTQQLIAANLERAGHRVVKSSSVREARAALSERLPALAVVDWMLPETTGVSFVKQLRSEERTREIPIIMLTGRGDELDKVTGLEAGADDYLTKPFSPRELIARVKAVMRRQVPQHCDEVVELRPLRLDPVAHRLTVCGERVDLGATEFRLLHFFMTHPNRVFTRAQLLDKVWGDHVYVEERTLDVHVRRLRQMLDPYGQKGLIETERGLGYRFRSSLDGAALRSQ